MRQIDIFSESELNNNEPDNSDLGAVMHRTWKILLIVGLLGLITELIFLIVKLAIVIDITRF